MWRLRPIHFCLFTFAVCLATASPPLRADPNEARLLVDAKCTMCHSTDLIAQQRLDRTHWDRIVRKMRSWGAVLSEGEVAMLVAYLAATYGPDETDR